MTVTADDRASARRLLVPSLVFIALVGAAVGSLGAPLITSVAMAYHVSLASAQWTLTITLLAGAVATPVLGRLGAGPVLVTATALAVAFRAIPAAPSGRSATIDVPGAGLLAAGLLAILLAASQTSLWTSHLAVAAALTGGGLALLAAWAWHERRAAAPLVDVRLIRHRAVATANAAMLVGGAGMYLLLTLITRYAQTPPAAGYGFGLDAFEAGLVLVPFSALGFVVGKVTPKARNRLGAPAVLAGGAVAVLAAFALFALARSSLAEILAAIAILGFGVGAFSAAMPAVILAVTPAGETSSAMSFNQVVRSVGFSAGSAAGGLILSSSMTAAGFPRDSAYSLAAWIGAAVMAGCALTCLAPRGSGPGWGLSRSRAGSCPVGGAG